MKAASAITSVRYDVFGVVSGGSLLLLLLVFKLHQLMLTSYS